MKYSIRNIKNGKANLVDPDETYLDQQCLHKCLFCPAVLLCIAERAKGIGYTFRGSTSFKTVFLHSGKDSTLNGKNLLPIFLIFFFVYGKGTNSFL